MRTLAEIEEWLETRLKAETSLLRLCKDKPESQIFSISLGAVDTLQDLRDFLRGKND